MIETSSIPQRPGTRRMGRKKERKKERTLSIIGRGEEVSGD